MNISMVVGYDMPNAKHESLNQNLYSDWQAEFNAGASIIITFSGCKQCSQMPLFQSPTLTTETKFEWKDETQTAGGPLTCLVTFFVALNSWSLSWSWHFLPMIITTFLECTWQGVSSNKMSLFSRSVCFDGLLGTMIKHLSEKEWRTLPISPMTMRDDHRQKISRPCNWPRVSCTKCHQACESRSNFLSLIFDHHSRARDTDMILFQSEFLINMSVTFCRTHHSKKITLKRLPKRWLLKRHQACNGHINCLSNTFDYHNWSRDTDMDFVSVRTFYEIDSDILQH